MQLIEQHDSRHPFRTRTHRPVSRPPPFMRSCTWAPCRTWTRAVQGLVQWGPEYRSPPHNSPSPLPSHATTSTPSAYTFPFTFPNTFRTISTLLLRLPFSLTLSNLALSYTSAIHSSGTRLCHAKSNHAGFSSVHLHQFACTHSLTSSRIARH